MTEYRNSEGELHREGGEPAREWADGSREWWVNGVQMTEEEAWALAPPPVQGPIPHRFHFVGLEL